MIVNQYVVWVPDPEASRTHIGVRQRVGWLRVDDKVLFNNVPPLSAIFDRHCVTFGVVEDVLDHAKVLHSSKHCTSVVGVHDDIVVDGRVCGISILIEVDWVSSDFPHLAHVRELDIRDAGNALGGVRCRNCEMGSVLSDARSGVSLEHNIAIKESNFCLDSNCVSLTINCEALLTSLMPVGKV